MAETVANAVLLLVQVPAAVASDKAVVLVRHTAAPPVIAVGVNDKLPKFVVFEMPVAVPPNTKEVMLPGADEVEEACTCKPVIVIASKFTSPVPLTLSCNELAL